MADGFIGQSLPRVEDTRLLRGAARFVDDLHFPGMVEMAVLRSPHAHARIRSVDLAAARAMPGVIDAFDAGALGDDPPRIPIRLAPLAGLERYLQAPLASDTVRYVGEPVAVVVATDRYLAEDALAWIEVDYDPLDPLTDVAEAPDDPALRYRVGRGDIDEAFAGAAYRRRETFRTGREAPSPLETRGLVGEFDPASGRLRLWGATKVTYFNRSVLARALGMAEADVELVEVEVGGGFGVRGELYPEDYLVPIAARRLARPVKWIEDRREHLMAANHSRDVQCTVEIAADADGRIRGLAAEIATDVGAFARTNGGIVPVRTAQLLPGPYRIPHVACEVRIVPTNKTPVGTYRGPGGFEANFFRERLIDMMAADLGLDPAEVRRRNLIGPDELPFRTGELVPGETETAYVDGDYPAVLEHALDLAAYDSWDGRQGWTDAEGRRHGLGIACFVEASAVGPPETARITADAHGGVEVRVGASAVGQGLETGMAQIAADALGIAPETITVRHGTTSLLEGGGGTYASRSTVMAGNAVHVAAEALRARSLELAALRWNTDPAALSFADGGVTGPSGSEGGRLGLAALADFAASRGETLAADGSFDNAGRAAWSSGAQAVHVAVDVETGAVEVLDHLLVEDLGRVLNPMMAHGQAVGSLVQGIGGALVASIVHDDDGQLLTATLADYLLPTSTNAPHMRAVALENFPASSNPMGFKGAGEGGIVAVGAAIGNAVAQALGAEGIQPRETPITPARLRAAIER